MNKFSSRHKGPCYCFLFTTSPSAVSPLKVLKVCNCTEKHYMCSPTCTVHSQVRKLWLTEVLFTLFKLTFLGFGFELPTLGGCVGAG